MATQVSIKTQGDTSEIANLSQLFEMGLYENRLNFRNRNADSRYIILLPLIGLLNLIKNGYEDSWQQLMFYIYVNSVFVLLYFRYYAKNFALFLFVNFSITVAIVSCFSFGNVANVLILVFWCNPLFLFLLQSIHSYLHCFTFAEFSLVFQSFMVYGIKLLIFNLQYFGIAQFGLNLYQNESDLFCLIFYTSLLVAFICINLTNIIRNKFLGYFILFPSLLYYYLSRGLSKEPVTWLLQYTFGQQKRIELFGIWLTVLALTICFVIIHTYTSQKSTTTATRKIFHISISIVYLIGIKNDVPFLEFSSKLVLFAFIFVEIVRLSNITWISPIIGQIFERFRDEKDSGILTLTHIYLLVGCSLPLWLATGSKFESKLLLSSGIISIGIGDTFASLGGFFFGKHRWDNSSKTYEGTFCAFISQIVAFYLIDSYCSQYVLYAVPLLTYTKVCLISLFGALFETFTSHVDNLILPFVQYALIAILF